MTYVRAHQHATGQTDQGIARSIGGNSSKIHLAVDAHGNPIEFIITNGLIHDVKVASELIDQIEFNKAEVICANKGYDSDQLREIIVSKGMTSNIPKK